MAHVVETLGVEADHVLFGHLHHPGEWTSHGGDPAAEHRNLARSGCCCGVRHWCVSEGPPELSYPLAA